jgi:hypothetical protein
MSVRARLQRWWDRMLGRPPWYRDTNVTISRTALYSEDAAERKPAVPAPDELTLVDDDGVNKRRTHRSAGVDPYSNDAGFAKPHGWERKERD